MTRSFLFVMLMPLALFWWVKISANFLRHIRYRMMHMTEQDNLVFGQNEQPTLILEYDNTPMIIFLKIFPIILCLMCLFAWFTADKAVHRDMHYMFFSLNPEHTYILYYWAWKFQIITALLIFGWMVFKSFNKRVYFFNNAVVLENALIGKNALVLDDNVRITKHPSGNGYWLYNELSMKYIQIVNKKLMKLDAQQEKLLKDFLSKIPEKKKTFYI